MDFFQYTDGSYNVDEGIYRLVGDEFEARELEQQAADAQHFNLFCYLLRLTDGARRLGVLNVRWEECGTHDVVRGELGPPVSTAIPKSESLRPGVMDPRHEFFTGTKAPRWNWCQNGKVRRNLPPTARDVL